MQVGEGQRQSPRSILTSLVAPTPIIQVRDAYIRDDHQNAESTVAAIMRSTQQARFDIMTKGIAAYDNMHEDLHNIGTPCKAQAGGRANAHC